MASIRRKMKLSPFDMAFDTFVYILMVCVGIVTLYPFLNVLAISFNDATDSVSGGIYLWPRVFSLANYRQIFEYNDLLNAFEISVLRTIIGTVFGVLSASMVAYTISRRDFVGRRLVSVMFATTLYISGGMIPVYMLIRNLHLMNTFWVYILPGLVSGWNIFVLRSYIDGLPISLQESAKLDGANDFVIFYRIILPLCLPVVATISLFIAVGQWNAWFDTFLYNSRRSDLSTLQYELMKILTNTAFTANNSDMAHNGNKDQIGKVSPESIRMAITIVATVPILLVYPFLQKYFVKGLTLGAVKA